MARQRKVAKQNRRQAILAAALTIGIIVAGVYFLSGYSQPQSKAVLEFSIPMSIQVENNNASQIRYIVPPLIGRPGGTWMTSALTRYGVNSNYPLYTDLPAANYSGYTVIHVASNTVYNFTLGDFFAVWGQPIGPNQTLTLQSHPPDGAIWSMCVGPSQTQLRPGMWGNEVLKSGSPIILIYGRTGCL